MITLPLAGIVPSWLLLVTFIITSLWLISEFKCGIWPRLSLGILTLIIVVFVVTEYRLIIPTYTEAFLNSSISTSTKLIRGGREAEVADEFAKFESESSINGVYISAMQLNIRLTEIMNRTIEHAPPAGRGEAPRP
jgi:hypothetical protein